MTDKEFNQSVDLYADRLYRFMYKVTGHEEDSKDLVQGSFEKLWINREKVINEQCRLYLFTIAYNQMLDMKKKNNRIELRDEFNDGKLVTYQPQSQLKQILNEAISTLSEIQQTLIILKDYEGYNYEELGRITGLNQSQVKVYIHRARLHLKNYLVKAENVI